MLFIAIACLILSALASYLIGAAFIAPRESFWRTKRGVLVLVLGGLSLVTLPPQMTMLDGMLGSAAAGTLSWPESIGKGTYLVAWAASSVLALLLGFQVWRAGSPERAGGGRAYDASGGSRVESLLPMAKDLADALDIVQRAGLTARDLPRVTEPLRGAGRRFASEMPSSDGALYQLVAARVAAPVAGPVTDALLQGAGRRGARGQDASPRAV